MGAHPRVSVIVPWHCFQGLSDRTRNLAHIRSLWMKHFPDWHLVMGRLPADQVWNKGLAVHEGLTRTEADVIIVADADVWLDQHQLLGGYVNSVHTKGGWMVPHGRVMRLSEKSTVRIIGQRLDWRTTAVEMARAPYLGVRGGGMFIIRREDYESIGGIDHRFEGWGWEDTCFGYAADTLLGKSLRGESDLIHFYHEPHVTRKKPHNRVMQEHLRGRYLRARNFPKVMQHLTADLSASKDKAMVDLTLL